MCSRFSIASAAKRCSMRVFNCVSEGIARVVAAAAAAGPANTIEATPRLQMSVFIGYTLLATSQVQRANQTEPGRTSSQPVRNPADPDARRSQLGANEMVPAMGAA